MCEHTGLFSRAICIRKGAIKSAKNPANPQNFPQYPQKSPTYSKKNPTHPQKSPTQRRANLSNINLPRIPAKEPYISEKEPSASTKEPDTLTYQSVKHQIQICQLLIQCRVLVRRVTCRKQCSLLPSLQLQQAFVHTFFFNHVCTYMQ